MEKRQVFLEKHNFLSWFFVLAISLLIFYISSLSFKGVGAPCILSYIYHFFIFFWLSFFLSIALVKFRNAFLIIPSILLASVYAVSDEFHQLFVQGRACSFDDFLIDSAGILMASLFYLLTVKIRNKPVD